MDWLDIGLGAGLIAFIMALVTLLADWIMQYWLVIRWGPNVTKKLVIGEFKNKDTAREVRESLDLPTRAELKELKEELRAKDLAYQATLDSRMGAMIADIKGAMPSLDSVEARIPAAVEAAVKSVSSGFMGAEVKKRNKEMDSMTDQYMASQFAKYDQQYNAALLAKMGISPGAAQFAATYGPIGLEWALREAIGDKRAADMMGQIAAAKAASMPLVMPGVRP